MRVYERQREVRVVSATGTEVCARALLAERSLQRLRGLLGRSALPPGAGLLLRPCASVHTLFLHHPIDVVFLDSGAGVLRIVPALRPWRAAAERGARSVLELPAGSCERVGIVVGDRLCAEVADPLGQLLEQRPRDRRATLDERAERPDRE